MGGNEGSALFPHAGNSKKSPINLFSLHPGGVESLPHGYQLSPASHCASAHILVHHLHTSSTRSLCILCTMDSGGDLHRFIIFHVSACTGSGTGTHIRPSPFLNAFPPFALCAFSCSFFFNLHNGICYILPCMHWQVMVVHSIGDCKKSWTNQGVSDNIGLARPDNIGLILIHKEIGTSWMKTTLLKPFTSKKQNSWLSLLFSQRN